MSFTPFNAPLLSGLLGDTDAAAFFSVKADIDAMVRFEVELARAQAALGVIPTEAAQQIATAAAAFAPDMKLLSEATARDGMAVPEFVRQLRAVVGDPDGQYVHHGATSQDVIDTSMVLRMKGASVLLDERLQGVLSTLEQLSTKFGSQPLLARTRMQVALPITVADRIAIWSTPLQEQMERHHTLAAHLLKVQLGGPVGTLQTMGPRGAEVRNKLADNLALHTAPSAWHTNRNALTDYANWLARLCGNLGKIGLDFALMAQDEIAAVSFSGSGGSSAMAHKQNPVKAEALVTLSRFAATLLSGMHVAAVHEQERSGASWMLEWMLLPQLVVAAGASLRNAQSLLSSIEHMGETFE